MRRPSAIAFDLDGTLVDSHGSIRAALEATLSAHGLPLDEARFRLGMSKPLRDMLAVHDPAADDPRLDSLVAGYLDAYVRTMVERSPPFDGIVCLLDGLLDVGVPLAVLTNKTEENARRIVVAHFGDRFREVIGVVPGRATKPHPGGGLELFARLGVSPSDGWLVGDSAIDVAAARAIGCVAVGATWGIAPDEHAGVADADCVVAAPADLLARVRGARPFDGG